MKVQKIDIDKLKPHPKNPRIHPDSAIEKLERSIKEFGWTNPILVSKDGYILAGHARLKAANKVGLEEVPAIYLPLQGSKAEAYMIADNRLQEESFWNIGQLNDLLIDLIGNDIDKLLAAGFEDYEIDRFLKEENEEKFISRQEMELADTFNERFKKEVDIPKEKEKPKTKKDSNWFYIEFYKQDEKFLKLIEECKARGVLVEENKICSDYFFNLVRKRGEVDRR